MNILCDQCVNRDVVIALRQSGFNTVHTSEVGLSRANDQDVFRYAQRSRRVLLTFDRGFGNITQFAIRNSHGIVLVYIVEMSKQMILERTLYVFEKLLKNKSASHQLILVEKESIRIWPKA